MRFILEMASGTEYLGDDLSHECKAVAKKSQAEPAQDVQFPQLQLATVQATASAHKAASTLPALDIEALIQGLED